MRKGKRITSLVLSLAIICSSICIDVGADNYNYNVNVLKNPRPTSGAEWNPNGGSYYHSDNGGSFYLDGGSIWQDFYLSKNDIERTKNGEINVYLKLKAWTGKVVWDWAQFKFGIDCYRPNQPVQSMDNGVKEPKGWLDYTATYTLPADTNRISYFVRKHAGYKPQVQLFEMKIIDTQAPSYNACYPVTGQGQYPAGTTIRYALDFSEPVNVVASSNLTMNSGGTANYVGQNENLKTLYYEYTIPASGTISDNYQIKPTSVNNVEVRDDAGQACIATGKINAGAIYMDNKPPKVQNFGTTASTGATYTTGEKIRFNATFTEFIKVTGTPSVTLNTGKKANYISLTESDTNQATFEYAIVEGDNTAALGITSCDFTGIKDKVGNLAEYNGTQHNGALDGYNVKIDTKAPTATFNEIDSNRFYGNNLEVKVDPRDELSEIKEVYSAWNTSHSIPTFPGVSNVASPEYSIQKPMGSGIYYLFTKIIDATNNIGVELSPYTYKFDFDKPTIAETLTKIEGTDIIRDVVIDITDSGAGVKSGTYKWKNSEGTVVQSGAIVNGEKIEKPTQDGIFSIEITAIDQVDNQNTKVVSEVKLDATAPTVEFSPNGNASFLQSHITNVSVEDEKSGLDHYNYLWAESASAPSIEDENWTLGTESSYTTPTGKTGSWYLHIKAEDKAGNVKIYSSSAFNIDNTAPSIEIIPNGNVGNVGRNEYLVGVTINDANTLYKDLIKKYIVSPSETCPESGLLDLAEDNITISGLTENQYLYIQVTDKAGNINTFKSNVFAADLKAPQGSIAKETDQYYVNQKAVNVNLTATDDYAESLLMQFAIDNGEQDWEDFNEKKTIMLPETEQEHVVKVRFKDECNNISDWYEANYYYDVTKPEITLQYSETNPTSGEVTVTATATDNCSEVTFETATEKVFTENGVFDFTVVDGAGNRQTKRAEVSNIDQTPPTIGFASDMFDGKKYQSVSVKVQAEDLNKIGTLRYRILHEEQAEEFVTCENGETITLSGIDGTYQIEVEATDTLGNKTTKISTKLLLDNTAPTGTVKYTPSSRTAQNVVAQMVANEKVLITNNEGSDTYEFEDNGDFAFEFEDEAGNVGSLTATVDFIDRTIPKANAEIRDIDGNKLSLSDWTNKTVDVSVMPPANSLIENILFNEVPVSESEDVKILNDGMFDYYRIQSYGILKFDIRDTETQVVGNGEMEIRVDKTAPTISRIDYTTKEPTNQNVTATVIAADDLSTVTYAPSNTHTFTENGTVEITVSDLAGNITTEIISVNNIDKETPIGEITYTINKEAYNTNDYTNQNVLGSISFPNETREVTITNNKGNATYEFSTNGEFTFEFVDAAGNTGIAKAKVDKIDKIAPTGYVTYSVNGWTNQNVVATLHATDDKTEIVYENTDGTHTFTENGAFDFEVKDLAGNSSKVKAVADRIDKTPPTLSYITTPPADISTPFSVFVQLTADEPITILNVGASPTIRFTSNGTYTFNVQDRAKNAAKLEVRVDHISRKTTPVRLEYSESTLTNSDVFAKIYPENINDVIFVQNNKGERTYRFRESGQFIFEYTNNAGIDGTAIGEVNYIDKVAPKVDVAYSTQSITNQDVTATLTADKDVLFPNGVEDGKYTFTQNEKIIVPVKDLAGNVTYVTLEVNLIDKEAPQILFEKEFECVPVGTTIDVLKGVKALDNIALAGDIAVEGTVDGNTNGDYKVTYTVADTAGNSTVKEKYFTVYDPTAFNVIINDKMPIGGQIISETKEVNIETVNQAGKVLIKYLPNKKTIGDFKDGGIEISKDFVFTESGYYTLYICDSENQLKIVSLFVR